MPEPGHPCTLCLLHLISLSCLVPRLARFVCFVSFRCPPPSRMAPSSQFLLPSRYRTTRCTHGIRAHVSHTQNSYPCIQPNKITPRTGPTTKTTKHDWVHDLSMHLIILDCRFNPTPYHQSNQSHPKCRTLGVHADGAPDVSFRSLYPAPVGIFSKDCYFDAL